MKQATLNKISDFELKLRRKEMFNSHELAKETIQLIRSIIKEARSNLQCEEFIIQITERLMRNFPNEATIKNVCSQIKVKLDEVKAEFQPKMKRSQSARGFLEIFSPQLNNDLTDDFVDDEHGMKQEMIEIIDAFRAELDESYKGISKKADEFLHNKDIILTVGNSESVINFLKEAHCNLTVIVPERAPEFDGLDMANKLRKHKHLKVIVIPDSAVFAVIPKVDTVILSARSVFANGGIISYSLTHSVALAAKRYSKPVIALYWEMKLASEMYHPGETYTTLRQPSQIADENAMDQTNTTVINPEGDYIPPELITLMKNETKSHIPTDVFSLVQQNYFIDW